MRATAVLVSALALTSAACSHSRISGTNIDDSPAARAILDVFTKYRQALEARDATALVALAAPNYSDPGDEPHGVGPVEYGSLPQKVQKDFAKVTGLRLEATVKDLNIEGERARLDYFQVLRYAVATPAGERWKSESDDARMKFVKVSGEWKIASGL
jgi:hypothetical protein